MQSGNLVGNGLENREEEGEEEEGEEELGSELVCSEGAIILRHNSVVDRGLGDRCWEKLSSLCSPAVLRRTWVVKESFMLLKLTLPLFFLYAFQQIPLFTTLLFIGRFSGCNSKENLSAVALGNSIFLLTGFTTVIGLATAADTLCPQSYGYKNYKRVGVIFQRGVLILSLACMPVAALWLNAESILLLLRQVPMVARLTWIYLSLYALALPGLVAFTMLQKYLQAQSLVWVFVVAGLIVNAAVVACCGIFIVAADMGVVGAGLSIALSTSLAPVFLVVYIKWRKLHRQTWGGWSFESLTEWWQFLRLGLPGFLMLAFEWWSFEISAIVVGTISDTQLAICGIPLLYANMLYNMIPFSLSVAVNIRVGNELGAGNPESARRVSYISLAQEAVIGLLVAATMLTFRDSLGAVFTSDKDVIEGVGDAMYCAVGVFFFDHIQGVASGTLRATGRQAKAALVNFLCYYVIGLPLGITMALVVGLQAKGMWIGLSVADGIQALVYVILLLTTDWKKHSEKAIRDSESGGGVAIDSLSMEEDCDGTRDSGIELRDREEGEGEGYLEGEDLLVSCKDSEMVSQDSPPGVWNRILYSNSSKCCRTKASIVISKGMFLIVGVAVLLVGAVLAGTIRRHPTNDDQCSNTSLVSTVFSDFPTPTRTSDEWNTAMPHLTITPSLTATVIRTSEVIVHPAVTPRSEGRATYLHLTVSPSPVNHW